MKFSYKWLKELSKTKKTSDDLCQMIMLKGFEVEERENLKDRFEGFIIGEIKTVREHKNADKLRVALVDLGRYGSDVQIVCGASNIEKGQKVPVALPGAVLPNSKMQIKKTSIRGEKSNGMLCSEDELGIGKDASGIKVLDKNLKPGTELIKALELDDEVLDFDILPNRAHDCMNHQGMAREIRAMEGKETKEFLVEKRFENLKRAGKKLEIEIKDKKLCPRYMGAVLENIKIQPSPAWMQARLIASGMEPINNIVDITNYVMLETGNPLHAFDADKLAGKAEKKITVRRAGKREKLTLLDGSDLELSEDDLVIADSEKPLALAGIKGGKDSGINSETSSIILEAANFNAYSIRKTRQRHTIQTDSQARFEKSISPFLAGKAMQRAVELLEKYAGADLKKVVEESFFSDEKQTVDFDLEAIEKLLGEKISLDKALKILENLGFEIVLKEKTKGVAKMPRERLDVESGNDLAEEIGRIIGYEKIKPEPLRVEIKEPAYNQEREMEWKMKEILAGLGFDEVINYSFYGKKEAEDGQIKGKHWELENPIASDKNLMRKTLLPAIIENVAFNRKNFDDFSLFELSRVYTTDEKKPEKLKLAGACFDKNTARDAIFYETKGKLEAFIEKIAGVEAEFNFLQESLISFLHPVRTAEIFVEGKKAGFLGEFNPDLSGKYKIKEPFCLFELDFDALFKNAAKEKIFREIQKFPSVERDLAMFVNMETSFKEVKEIIEKAGGKHLQGIELFDIYEDRKQNRKSFAFHFDFYNPKKTLTGEEADLFVEKIIAELEKKGVEVRKN